MEDQSRGCQHLVGVVKSRPARLELSMAMVRCCAQSISASDCRHHVSGLRIVLTVTAESTGLLRHIIHTLDNFKSARKIITLCRSTLPSSFARRIRHSKLLPSCRASDRFRVCPLHSKSIEMLRSRNRGIPASALILQIPTLLE